MSDTLTTFARVLGLMPGDPTRQPVDVEQTRPTPDVDDAGAGASPITPPLDPGNVQPASHAAGPPEVLSLPDKQLAGATKVHRLGAPARTASFTSYTLTNGGQPVRVALGSDEKRRVTVYVASDPGAGMVYVAQDGRQDATGAPLPAAGTFPLVYESGDPLWLYWPAETVPGDAPVVAVIIEPR